MYLIQLRLIWFICNLKLSIKLWVKLFNIKICKFSFRDMLIIYKHSSWCHRVLFSYVKNSCWKRSYNTMLFLWFFEVLIWFVYEDVWRVSQEIQKWIFRLKLLEKKWSYVFFVAFADIFVFFIVICFWHSVRLTLRINFFNVLKKLLEALTFFLCFCFLIHLLFFHCYFNL